MASVDLGVTVGERGGEPVGSAPPAEFDQPRERNLRQFPTRAINYLILKEIVRRETRRRSDSTGGSSRRLAIALAIVYNFVEMADTQISAYISDTTRDEVERYVEAHGVKKGSLVEQALLHHLQALRELPQDIVIPPRLRVTSRSFSEVVDLVKNPRKPTAALKQLMSGSEPTTAAKPKRSRSRH